MNQNLINFFYAISIFLCYCSEIYLKKNRGSKGKDELKGNSISQNMLHQLRYLVRISFFVTFIHRTSLFETISMHLEPICMFCSFRIFLHFSPWGKKKIESKGSWKIDAFYITTRQPYTCIIYTRAYICIQTHARHTHIIHTSLFQHARTYSHLRSRSMCT